MGVIDLVLELYMLKNSLLRVPKKAFFASFHTYFSNKKYQNDVKKQSAEMIFNVKRQQSREPLLILILITHFRKKNPS